MGVDTRKKSSVPPLPAPTETDFTTLEAPSELGTDLSRPGDENSSYSLPEDGTPVTIKTRGHRANKSQTSLLIEYFEGGKGPTGSSAEPSRKPSVRVRLTPSSKERKGDAQRGHIKITETKSRKTSLSRKGTSAATRSDLEAHSVLSGDLEDAHSMSSYASATEESNVSRNPIDIEIDRSGHARRRRPASPLIPAVGESKLSYAPGSDISAIPTDSFLDGSGPTTSTFKMSELKSRSRSPSRSRVGDALGGAAAGLAAAALTDKMRSKSRGESRDRERDRISVSKTRDKDRKHKSSKSRTSSISKDDKYADGIKSPRRKSSRSQAESMVSAADSSVLSSGFSGSHRTVDQQSIRSGASKASSINNPKLLETVEDAIRRLILPELDALKREQSKHKHRRSSATSSSSLSREDLGSERRRSSSATVRNDLTPRSSVQARETRDREARHEFDDSPSISGIGHESVEDFRNVHDTPQHDRSNLKAVAAGAGLAGAAVAMREALKSPIDDKRSRRRRRAELRSRGADAVVEDYDEELSAPSPPMPLLASELNTNMSEVTRASILSADTDRPHSASEELLSVRGMSRESLSAGSSPAPIRGPSLAAIGAQHANISHGDLRSLPVRRETGEFTEEEGEYQSGYGNAVPQTRRHEIEEDEYEDRRDFEPPVAPYDYYNSHQDVPPPLKYVPYQPERRGLSPIPSVSGFTEGGSEVNRNSALVQDSLLSTSDKSVRHDRALHSPSSIPSNIMGREFGEDERSVRSSGVDYRNAMSVEESEVDRASTSHAVRALGANPNFVHSAAIESNVASLVDGSMLDGSLLTGESNLSRNRPYDLDENESHLEHAYDAGHASPSKQSARSGHEYAAERGGTPVSSSQRSREFAEEYDIDEYGRKVPAQRSRYRQSPTTSEAAITGAAVTAAAAALKAHRDRQHPVEEVLDDDDMETAGVQRNKSFKERAMNGQQLGPDPKHSIDRLSDHPQMGFTAVPHPDDMMPGGEWQDDMETNPSMLNGEEGFTVRQGYGQYDDDHNSGDITPTRHTPLPLGVSRSYEHRDIQDSPISASQEKTGGLTLTETAGAAALGAAAAMAAKGMHSRQASQEHEDDWHRSSDDRKRDTLLTNPYEGASPIVNLEGLGVEDSSYHDAAYGNHYRSSPLDHKDEGYISQGPAKSPDVQKGKEVGFSSIPTALAVPNAEDPFFAPNHQRHLSGLSQGMGSPLYDSANGTGIESIESKDIIALMQHLMVRDAQRSARDTEILVTLVRSAAEMRNSFEDIKKMLADTEDVIITEVKDNTEKTVQRAINGPRPYPGSASRSIQGVPSFGQSGTVLGEDLPTKKRNFLRRALKGLGNKGPNDLTRIEDMLNQLLDEVDVLKEQTSRVPPSRSPNDAQYSASFRDLQPEGQYEQDHGYEPEGQAGTSTASHASQSGHLSIPNSRATSTRLGYDRKVSANRISTVPEANEDEYDHAPIQSGDHIDDEQYLMTPATEKRAGSVPLGTPPQAPATMQTSTSQDNTPRTEEGKKTKAGRTSWFPKISRWSETTTSSVAQAFRRSGQSRKNEEEPHSSAGNFHAGQPSRSGSIGAYSDNFQFQNPHADDHLHTGFTEEDLTHGQYRQNDEDEDDMGERYDRTPTQEETGYEGLEPPPPITGYRGMTPEDPKYKAHRNSLNLQHPQPHRNQTERFKANLETQVLGYDSPVSPHSADWAGSATSLNRFPRNANRESYGSAADQQARYWTSSPGSAGMTATAGPPRPPKEPLDAASPGANIHGMGANTPPKHNRLSKLQKNNSPLPHHSVESGYGTMTHGVPTASYISQSRDGGSPHLENRNLSGALGVPTRRPSGPRAMAQSPKSGRESLASDDGLGSEDRRRKRDTFGTVASNETDTF